MILLIITIVLAVLTLIGLLSLAIVKASDKDEKGWFALLPLAGLPFLLLLFGSFTKVKANEVSIVYDDRYGIVDKVYEEGFHTKSIFEHVTTISTLNRDKYIETSAQTKDGQYAEFQIAITYAVEKADAPKFYKTTGGDKSATFDDQLKGLIEKDLQKTTIEEDIFELLSTRLEETRIGFERNLKESLKNEYGVTLRFATFKDVDAGADIEDFIKQEATAAKQKEINEKQAEADLTKAEAQAAIKKAEAEAELEKAKIDAQIAEQEAKAKEEIAKADAFAISETGKAKAEAANAYTDKILSMIDSLSEEQGMEYSDAANTVLSIVFYDSWDGVLPTTLTSDSLSGLIGALIAGE